VRWLAWWRKGCTRLADRHRIEALMIRLNWERMVLEGRALGLSSPPPLPSTHELAVSTHELKAALWDALAGNKRNDEETP